MEKTSLKTTIKGAVGTAILVGAAAVAAHFMQPIEGLKYKAYRDGGGIWTICSGHTKGVFEGMIADDQQCKNWYADDVNEAQSIFEKYVIRTDTPNNTKAASISFIFNTGTGNFRNSTLLKKLKVGDRSAACAQFIRWKFQDAPIGGLNDMADGVKNGKADCFLAVNKKFCGGLKDRRLKETALCLDNSEYKFYTWVDGNYFVGGKK